MMKCKIRRVHPKGSSDGDTVLGARPLMGVRIAIVTRCLERADFVADAAASIPARNGKGLEHIVVDGGSTGGTVEVLAYHPRRKAPGARGYRPLDAVVRGRLEAWR
jgi:hypothetical protein